MGRVRSWRSLDARLYGLHVWGSYGKVDRQSGIFRYPRVSELAS